MTGLSPDLSRRLREILTRCGPFDSNTSLRAAFVDARLAPWRDSVPEADSRAARVNALIAALLEQRNSHGNPALALFVEVLAESVASGDACHGELAALAAEVQHVLAGETAGPAFASADPQAALIRARRALATLEEQAAGYTSLTIPVNLKLDLEDKRREVTEMEGRLRK